MVPDDDHSTWFPMGPNTVSVDRELLDMYRELLVDPAPSQWMASKGTKLYHLPVVAHELIKPQLSQKPPI